MSVSLRIILVVIALITCFCVIRKIRKSQVVIEDTLFWLFFSLLLVALSFFPQIAYFFSDIMGFVSPSNFIFVVFIFLLLVKIFSLSIKISKLETKLENLVEKYAIDFQKKQ